GNCGGVRGQSVLTETAGTWDAGAQVSLPADANYGSGGLNSVSCTPDGGCTAVGTYRPLSSSYAIDGLLIGGTAPAVKLDVSTHGAGSGSISSDVGGIGCGSTCSASFDAGALVTLAATPAPGSRFIG